VEGAAENIHRGVAARSVAGLDPAIAPDTRRIDPEHVARAGAATVRDGERRAAAGPIAAGERGLVDIGRVASGSFGLHRDTVSDERGAGTRDQDGRSAPGAVSPGAANAPASRAVR